MLTFWTLVPQTVMVFEKRVIADVANKDEAILKKGGPLIQDDWYPFTRGNLDTHMHTGRTRCENKGRGQDDTSTS